jgi:phosphotransacetylase/acyl dehydratase
MKLVNYTFDELALGQTAELDRLITNDDLKIFAAASGNHNPLHLSVANSSDQELTQNVAPGMFIGSIISAVLGTKLPGAGTLYLSQTLDFKSRAHVGDTLRCRVEVVEKILPRTVVLATEVRRVSDHAIILSGHAQVQAPDQNFDQDSIEIPGLIVQHHQHFQTLIARAQTLPVLPTAVVCPHDPNSLGGALLAAKRGLIMPILIGSAEKIKSVASHLGEDLDLFEIIDVDGDLKAAAVACQLVHEGKVGSIMKGHLHTDDLLKPTLDKASGLRIGRRFTHIFVMDVPGLSEPIMVTDAAINIAPDLATKMDICQNAIDLAKSLGLDPRVGVLSAVETVNPAIQSSIDAALLSKMAERGQIKGALVDGPLAMDNAVDMGAARTKGLTGGVAGHANILVVPGIDAGNMLAKQLAYISHAEGAGLVLGAKVPIILNSRADSPMSRLASCAVASINYFARGQT